MSAHASAPQTVLFDFDGTLIDSAPGILASFEAALRTTGLTPAVPLSPALIGPPLAQTAATLLGRDDPAAVQALVAAFRDDYDTAGYRATAVYEGVPEMLDALAAADIALHIVTNKRIAATRLILDHLGWTPRFTGIYALDALTPPAPHKPALVAEVLRREGLTADRSWMVGDSAEDRRAALANDLRFFGAAWGYGAAAAGDDALTAPGQLLRAAGIAS
ncbi:MAG: HAD family hydrolase [Gammaproteobacteria bacterium]